MKKFFKMHRVIGIVIASVLALSVIGVGAALALVRSADVAVTLTPVPQYSLVVNPVTGTIYAGDSFMVSGTLTSTNFADVANKTIKIFTAANVYSGFSYVTNSSGIFEGAVPSNPADTTLLVHAEFQP